MPVAGGLVCVHGHRFDRAREGYVHLLPSGRKTGGPAGDTPEMLQARRALFDAGHYEPVQRAVAGAVDASAATGGVVLDAGCGEGAYLRAVGERRDDLVRLGVDVAKAAVRSAAQRDRGGDYAVASSHRLPVADGAIGVVVSVFAPRAWAEFARVLSPDGIAVVASPGADHLDAVRRLRYAEPVPHAERAHLNESDVAGWVLLDRVDVRYELTVQGPDVEHLVHMTPYRWSGPAGPLPAVLTTKVHVVVTRHRPPVRPA